MTIGFNVAEEGHVIQVLPPQSISGGKTGQRFKMFHGAHVSFLVLIGAMGANAPSAILLKACKDSSGTGATAIGFRYYISKAGGQSIDLTSPPLIATTSGITTIDKVSNQFILIEVDSQETDATGDASQTSDFPWLEWSITDSGNSTQMSVAAIISGGRYQAQALSQPTATT